MNEIVVHTPPRNPKTLLNLVNTILYNVITNAGKLSSKSTSSLSSTLPPSNKPLIIPVKRLKIPTNQEKNSTQILITPNHTRVRLTITTLLRAKPA